jgi:hypothetical protein
LWATIRFVSFGDESQRQGVLETQTATPATAFERMQDSLQETSANHEDMMYESENREGATDTPPTSPLSPTPTETAGGQKNTFITPIPATL